MYTWLSKRSGKVHQVRDTGRTYCQVENNSPNTSRKLSKPSDTYPPDRRLCWCCKAIIVQETHGVMDAEYRSIVG